MQAVAGRHDAAELHRSPDEFVDAVLIHIGPDLNGYVIEEMAIDELGRSRESQH